MMKDRKRLAAAFLAAACAAAMSACGTAAEDTPASAGNEIAGTEDAGTDTAAADSGEESENSVDAGGASGGGNILIAYFTAAENSGVDADASASYSVVDGEAKGRLKAVADMIQEQTGGDLFSIQTDVVYPADGGKLIDYAAEEQAEDARPELTTHIEDLDSYEVVFVGYPNWWGDMPQVLYSFFDEYDFSGKTIFPFNVHNGSRFSGTIETIQELEPDAAVNTDGFTINEREVPDAADDVAEWLSGLGY